jgi:hypothetical protein
MHVCNGSKTQPMPDLAERRDIESRIQDHRIEEQAKEKDFRHPNKVAN